MLETPVAPPVVRAPDEVGLLARLKYFINPVDGRYEDLKKGNVAANILRDFTAGLIVAMVAIPLAMGFAMASGLRPEQGIVGGAIAGMIGALWDAACSSFDLPHDERLVYFWGHVGGDEPAEGVHVEMTRMMVAELVPPDRREEFIELCLEAVVSRERHSCFASIR